MPLRAPKGFIDETDPRVCQIGHPAPPWLINYADLMTELVCFFVIMYAAAAALNKQMIKSAGEINQSKNPNVSAEVTKEGLKITLKETNDVGLFQSGSAELTPEMQKIITSIVPELQKNLKDHDLIVEGHTDNVPIHNDLYLNNWELSSARATNVVDYLAKDHGLPAPQLAATGYGENRPKVPNTTPENRRVNRRIVFLVRNGRSEGAPPKPSEAEAKALKPGEGGEEGGEPPSAVAEEGEGKEVGTIDGVGVRGFVDDMLSKIKGK
ncbi:MAG: flagellar motor protein MotB [Elusimicrobia bacterium]|nr:flagellar motor protein MotB [Elusimicrobiota bacterium]